MPDGRTVEQRIAALQAEVQRLSQALRQAEPALCRFGYDGEGKPTHRLCRLCGAQAALDATIHHRQVCPFADMGQSEGEVH